MFRHLSCGRILGRVFLAFFILIAITGVVACSKSAPTASKEVDSDRNMDKARAFEKSVPAKPPGPVTSPAEPSCEGPTLISHGGKSVCFSCHKHPKAKSSDKIHRKHRKMSCCECHPR